MSSKMCKIPEKDHDLFGVHSWKCTNLPHTICNLIVLSILFAECSDVLNIYKIHTVNLQVLLMQDT